MAFQSKDSVLDLASLLEEHHDRHNPALDKLEDVGDSAHIPVGMDLDESEKELPGVWQNNKTCSGETTPPRRSILTGKAAEEDPLSPSSVAAAPLFDPSPAEEEADDKGLLPSDLYSPYYDFDPSLPDVHGSPAKSEDCFLGCVFPWLAKKEDAKAEKAPEKVAPTLLPRTEKSKEDEKPIPEAVAQPTAQSTAQPTAQAVSKEEEKVVSNIPDKSDVPTEVGPSAAAESKTEATVSESAAPAEKSAAPSEKVAEAEPKTLEMEVDTPAPTKPRKGILKNYSPPAKKEHARKASFQLQKKQDMDGSAQRRTLFTKSYTPSAPNGKDDKRKLQFSPMARVVTIGSHKDLKPYEKAAVWWSRKDYADFKTTSRLVTKAILTSGSEVWILTNSSWDTDTRKTGVTAATMNHSKKSVSEKWWCKFGHSRRGLEHVTSPEEGKERSAKVKRSIQSVLEEQRRQRKSGLANPQNIRQVYVRASQWSRQLCLAAAASDAEAVQHAFAEQRIRDRNYHLRRQVSIDGSSNDESSSSGEEEVPQFMKKHLSREALEMPEMTVEAIRDAPSDAELYHKQARGFGEDAAKSKQAAVAVM